MITASPSLIQLSHVSDDSARAAVSDPISSKHKDSPSYQPPFSATAILGYFTCETKVTGSDAVVSPRHARYQRATMAQAAAALNDSMLNPSN